MNVKPVIKFYYDDADYYEWNSDNDEVESSETEDVTNNHIDPTIIIDSTSLKPTQVAVDEVKSYSDVHPEDVRNMIIDECGGVVYTGMWARSPYHSSVLLTVAGHYGNEYSISSYYGNVMIMTTW
jgi:hypothetical protein